MEKILHPATTESTATYRWLYNKYSFSSANFLKANRMQNDLPDVYFPIITTGHQHTHGIWNTSFVANTILEDSRALLTEVSLN